MRQPLKDATSAVSSFRVPWSVAQLVAQIEKEAADTYTDHAQSRAEMVKQRLIEALASREERLQRLSQASQTRPSYLFPYSQEP